MSVSTRARSAGRAAARSEAVETAGRWGMGARGVIYLLVGLLAVRVAFGGTSRQADRGGAVAEIAERPFGEVMLWILGFGLVGMSVWQLARATLRDPGTKKTKRLAAAAHCVFYAVVAYSVLSFAVGGRGGAGGGGSSDHQSKDITARVLQLPLGPWLVAAGGCALIAAGGWIAVRASLFKDRRKRGLGGFPPKARRTVETLGVAGGVSRGVVFAAAGAFAVQAALAYDPDRAKGLDDTLRTFRGTPAGPWLLVVVATGLMMFGLYSLAMACRRSP
ncbi:DUF1206 domain-containing protein [Streptomyces sparsogenes]|uniref:DUF1206 domain-containing protein n=1 Tax=Streptomyces sparsogenes TaxID=67365 RepID=UPI003D9E238F